MSKLLQEKESELTPDDVQFYQTVNQLRSAASKCVKLAEKANRHVSPAVLIYILVEAFARQCDEDFDACENTDVDLEVEPKRKGASPTNRYHMARIAQNDRLRRMK